MADRNTDHFISLAHSIFLITKSQQASRIEMPLHGCTYSEGFYFYLLMCRTLIVFSLISLQKSCSRALKQDRHLFVKRLEPSLSRTSSLITTVQRCSLYMSHTSDIKKNVTFFLLLPLFPAESNCFEKLLHSVK